MIDELKNGEEINSLVDFIEAGDEKIGLSGLSGTSEAFFYGALFKKVKRPLFIISEQKEGEALALELESFMEEGVYYYPKRNLLPYKTLLKSREIKDRRLQIIKALVEGTAKVIFMSPEALLEKYPLPEVFKKGIQKVKIGDVLNREEFIEKLVASGYERDYRVEGKGIFSVRGDILDVFVPGEPHPYRLDFFDEEIEAIKYFDVETQRTIEMLDAAIISPATDLPLAFSGKKVEEGEDERFFPKYFDTLTSLPNYGKKPILIYRSYDELQVRSDKWYRELMADFDEGEREGLVDPIQRAGFFSPDLNKVTEGKQKVYSELFYQEGMISPGIHVEKEPIPSFSGDMETFYKGINNYLKQGYHINIYISSEEKKKGLESFCKEKGLMGIQYIIGVIEESFVLKRSKVVCIGEKTIFGMVKKQTKTKEKKKKIDPFTDIRIGDYVVHEEYGIAHYVGMVSKEILGETKDYLKLEFAGEGRLFIPADRMDVVEKYIGGEGRVPRLSNLGKNEWKKTKEKVRLAVSDIAKDLLKLYSERKDAVGFAFSKDTPWQKEFEDRFPYEETPDQMSSIVDVKDDMEKLMPMDRIVIGDVGYGKTEVALRAAFKAVMDGKQVVLLSPTTVLSQQHYRTFKERFEGFPVSIGLLNRFVPAPRIKETVKELKSGGVDIVIGTHRLLSKDISFKNLGLLIIDEEQKFGVVHKERIKALKTGVDCLVLSATPIPRTLHMALAGARDLSVIETPPKDRFPVQSYVLERDENVIAASIRREMKRAGQTYYVYNVVSNMKEKLHWLEKLLPEARIAHAHGQMDEKTLEKNMVAFLEGEVDVLLCTTIIENGLNIKNANTLIVENADRLGLSQIYQLKGRVGRGDRIGYSYFMFPQEKILSDAAKKRLKAIKELTELGSGFKIAMLDLEIRGAGNLLGKEQHGHLISVGFDLYCRLLEDEVEKLKGTKVDDVEGEELGLAVTLDLEAYFPESYIESSREKVELYKRISDVKDEQEAFNLADEIMDRFGTPPKSVENIFYLARIRGLCHELSIDTLTEEKKNYRVHFLKEVLPLEKLQELKALYGREVSFDGGIGLTIVYRPETMDNKGNVIHFLQKLNTLKN